MKKLVYSFLIVFTIITFLVSKQGYYNIQDVQGSKILVNRKGKLYLIWSPFKQYNVNDSIKLYGDYDWHWEPLQAK